VLFTSYTHEHGVDKKIFQPDHILPDGYLYWKSKRKHVEDGGKGINYIMQPGTEELANITPIERPTSLAFTATQSVTQLSSTRF
jgi:hypothetical protein